MSFGCPTIRPLAKRLFLTLDPTFLFSGFAIRADKTIFRQWDRASAPDNFRGFHPIQRNDLTTPRGGRGACKKWILKINHMVTFPYYSKYYDSRLSCKDMNYRLDRLVNQSVGGGLFSNKFYGHLESNGFVAYKNSVYSNMTLVKIVGKYREVDENTKLNVKFMLSEYVLVFYLIFIFSLSFIFFLILFEPIYIWLKFMPLVMIFVSYILIIIPFNFISKDAEVIIEQLLELER